MMSTSTRRGEATTTTPTRLRAGAPVSVLLRNLRRAGWGALSGRQWQGLRSTLVALADHVGNKTGRGIATAEQICAGTGLSERWTRISLQRLEELEVISWQRGGVRDGTPEPSAFRISKARLVELIEEARPERDKAVMLRRQQTAARLAQIRVPHLRSKQPVKRLRRSAHAELSADLLSPDGEEAHRTSVPDPEIPRPRGLELDSSGARRRADQLRAELRPMRSRT